MRHPLVTEDLRTILADKAVDWSAFEGTHVLVSGASGFLPAYMVETLLFANEVLLSNKLTVIALVRNMERAKVRFSHYAGRPDLKLIEHDVALPFQWDGEVDYFIHAASQASPRYFFSDPVGTIKSNSNGTHHLLELALQKKARSFLYFSSGEVYGNIFDYQPQARETDYAVLDPQNVRNCYGISKKLGEMLCVSFTHQFGLPTRIVRPSHTYGPGFRFDDGRAFTSFVANVIQGKNIVLSSDGSACRSFLYLADATRAYFNVLLNGKVAEAYNVGNAYETSMLDVANLVIAASGDTSLNVEVNIAPGATASSTAKHGMLSIEKLQSLNWKPTIAENEGFRRTLDYYRKA